MSLLLVTAMIAFSFNVGWWITIDAIVKGRSEGVSRRSALALLLFSLLEATFIAQGLL